MKKVVLLLVLVSGSLNLVSAQQNAIGLKFGYRGADVSFQHLLNDANRLEFNLGIHSQRETIAGTSINTSTTSLSGMYQWIWDLSQLAPGFKWYAGVGVMAGIHTVRVANQSSSSDLSLWAIGNIGIEYNFEFPLQLALDWTPALRIAPDFGNFGGEWIKLAARFRF